MLVAVVMLVLVATGATVGIVLGVTGGAEENIAKPTDQAVTTPTGIANEATVTATTGGAASGATAVEMKFSLASDGSKAVDLAQMQTELLARVRFASNTSATAVVTIEEQVVSINVTQAGDATQHDLTHCLTDQCKANDYLVRAAAADALDIAE